MENLEFLETEEHLDWCLEQEVEMAKECYEEYYQKPEEPCPFCGVYNPDACTCDDEH